uniref:Large ribosomal subunit protein bL32c n=3 Tax=Saccharina TaxID=309357 RepID=A0A8K1W1Z9_9PHAE|nr:50S ribosomal protein L32 [Saccharina japonica]YP_010863399.1 50S ribosomal protein L32 [Saccharina japonica x Saccharina latissima]QOV02279.1 50S ribosomal protein L32 [Saccharina sp. ye-B]UFQ24817.1 50S ribosomal protein L32 [Saccharina sp. Rongfu]WAX38163.1 ribosomal protein L32 [Saccharina japonica cultivar 901]AFC40142.1 50S ribosomal protein L32 [Saccharina japonica]UFQ24956.1 50S ribosomal protein L32 [Saccharina sp. Rongfu]
MAVPKKRRSKAKGRTRLSNWKSKGRTAADKALNLAKSIVKKRSTFLFDPKKKKVEENSNQDENNNVKMEQTTEDNITEE